MRGGSRQFPVSRSSMSALPSCCWAMGSMTFSVRSPFTGERGSLLRVDELVTVFEAPDRLVRAVDGVSFAIRESEIFGLVGESGCGKSATCRSILRLFAGARARIAAGSITFKGVDLTRLSEAAMTSVRGAEIGMIFQDPMTALNPTMRIGAQIAEGLRRNRDLAKASARRATIEILDR